MRISDWSSDVCSSDLCSKDSHAAAGRALAGRELMRVTFIHADGKERTEVEAEPGSILLDVAQAHMMPLEGTCEGQMACSTCHVIVAKEDFDRLPPVSEIDRKSTRLNSST